MNSQFNSRTQEHRTLKMIRMEMGVQKYFGHRNELSKLWNFAIILPAVHKLKSRLYLTVRKKLLLFSVVCQVISRNLTCLHGELFSKWQEYSKPWWWQNFSDRRPQEGRKILASRPLRRKGRTLPIYTEFNLAHWPRIVKSTELNTS